MRAHVLTYHSGNLAGNEYATNNLVALADDLVHLCALKIPVVPLETIVATRLSGELNRFPKRVVAVTLDDGLDFDFEDLVHPFHGAQASVRTVLERHEQAYGDPSDFVADEYFPRHGERNGTIVAFCGHPGVLHHESDRWRLPRYTCGMDWRSTAELDKILRD